MTGKKIAPPNYTQIPNVILDEWLKEVSPAAGIILMIICRQTFGWHKQSDMISQSQFIEKSGMTRNTVKNALAELTENGMIEQSKRNAGGKSLCTVYSIKVSKIDRSEIDGSNINPLNESNGSEIHPSYGSEIDPTKEIVKENNSTKEIQRPLAAKGEYTLDCVITKYNEVFKKNIKLTASRKSKLRATLKDHSVETLCSAIEGMKQDTWSIKNNRFEIERLIDPSKRDRNIELFSKAYKPTVEHDRDEEIRKHKRIVNERLREMRERGEI